MFERPTLPPMEYRLWLPRAGAYVRGLDLMSFTIKGTDDPARAPVYAEPAAKREAWAVIEATGQTVELRPVEAPDEPPRVPRTTSGSTRGLGRVRRTGEPR